MWKDRIKRRYLTRRVFSRRLSNVQKSRQLVKLAKIAFLGVVGMLLASFVIIPLFAFTLPSPDKIVRSEGFSTKILDRNGQVLYDIFSQQRRTPISFDEVPLFLKQATISVEDKNFYKHQGFDPLGMLRGLSKIITRGRVQGGSTLTQQLVKNALLTSERSIFRKIKEFILAVQIEKKYSKDEILLMYLNEIPYGGTAYGVEAASEVYFGKKAVDLNLVESAVIAGIPQRPSYYSPFSSNPEAYVERATQVLRRMREDDYITKDQEKAAIAELPNIEFQAKGAFFKAPHFVQYVQKILEDRYGENVVESGGLKVTTTLDWTLQEEMQDIVKEEIAKVEGQKITNGASVAVNPETGEILAMVGSKDFNDPNYDGQVNVTMSLRQPGSAIKPITYVTAFKEGYTSATMIMDVPTTFPGGEGQPDYSPVNYDGKYRGPMQLRYALGNSINLIAVKTLALVGIKDTLQTAYDLGITTLEPTKEILSRVGLSLTLGGGEVRLLELTSAYSAFTNKGFKVEPVSILKVEDSKGKVLEEVDPKKGKRVLSEEQAFLIADILSDNGARTEIFGTNSLLNISGRTLIVKTGTTNDKKDNWTVGGNSQIMIGVWVGNNDNSSMLAVVSGVSGASPIWRRSVLEALSGKADTPFEIPSGIVTASVDSMSGFRSHDGYPSRTEYFIKGTEPGEDSIHVRLKVCKNDGRLATPADISSGNYDENEYFTIKEEDPTAGSGGENRWQKGVLDWLSTQSDGRYHPPTEYCGQVNPINVEFDYPTDRTSDLPNDFTIKLRADSTSKIVQIELEIDGVKERAFDGPPFTYKVNDLSDGVHTIRAKAKDQDGNESDRQITIGVNTSWDQSPSPSPTSTL
ncbi:MAG: PBP1A family penicillin-binding protein [Patescibacteria group bacterium]|nr:PBP1A family penicillin-binding protein [Patescibacteria group bacterium]